MEIDFACPLRKVPQANPQPSQRSEHARGGKNGLRFLEHRVGPVPWGWKHHSVEARSALGDENSLYRQRAPRIKRGLIFNSSHEVTKVRTTAAVLPRFFSRHFISTTRR
jgi:hypothetical protein